MPKPIVRHGIRLAEEENLKLIGIARHWERPIRWTLARCIEHHSHKDLPAPAYVVGAAHHTLSADISPELSAALITSARQRGWTISGLIRSCILYQADHL